ncbi:hypothetical protein [Runella sp.]|uniref:hypothetical protein n=1 Tax=Runella sp. TaxID=1960881 RepID=UPI003D145E02
MKNRLSDQLQTRDLNGGHTDWEPRQKQGKSWFQQGTFTSPNGMCLIHMEATFTQIKTVAEGKQYLYEIYKPLTPRSVSLRCGKLLKKLNSRDNADNERLVA